MLTELFEALAPHLLEAFMALVSLATAYGVMLLRRWTGITIEAKHREALHSAIRTAVVDLAEGDLDADDLGERVRAYLQDSVPDAMRALLPGDTVLATLARRFVAERLQALAGPVGRKPATR